jgi:hypothetical protein
MLSDADRQAATEFLQTGYRYSQEPASLMRRWCWWGRRS